MTKRTRPEIRSQNSVTNPLQPTEAHVERAKLRSRRSLEEDENLIQAQQDAFDFSVLRSKLESRLKGNVTTADETVYVENSQAKQQALAEIQSKLSNTGTIRRTMNKWLAMDKKTNK
jgi:tRNA threonylcarbamoyladenosine modification (KEOPS) complex  Pcc1 subunit